MIGKSIKNKIKKLPPFALWTVGYAFMLGICGFLAYYWCVFYGFTQISKISLLLISCTVGTIIFAAIFILCNFVKNFDMRAGICVFLCGLCFVFVTPPFQVPDESGHYLRAYSISRGQFDFDASREYPSDVSALMQSFSFAWTNAHDGHAIKGEERVTAAYTEYFENINDPSYAPQGVKEPIFFTVLPYIPQSIFMAIARVLGFKALGVLFLGRVANLAAYALLCYFAFKNCKRYKSVFVAVALLPLCLFMAGSASSDAIVIGLMIFAASYYCVDEINEKGLYIFCAAVALMSAIKLNNILFVVLPLVLPQKVWRCKFKKWHFATMAAASSFALIFAFELYASLFSANYPIIPRQPGNDPMQQLLFVLSNIPRFCAITLGTLYENNFFIFNLGIFGNLDLNLPLVSGLSICVLLFAAALSAHEKSSLSAKSSLGLFGLAVLYACSVLAGLYLTHNPLYHIRINGLQARYFVPSFLMLMVLVSGLLSHVLEPRARAQNKALPIGLGICSSLGVYSALMCAQHYFIGPNFIP